jgi:hypothetical protein
MEVFSITCTTCKSRLRVRDQAAIGQILACPKCGGMVMVKPPPAFNEASEQRSDLPTATEIVGSMPRFDQTLDSSAFDVVEELLSDSPPKVQPPPSFDTPAPLPSATPTPKPRFVGGPPVVRSMPGAAGGAPKAHASPPPGGPAVALAPAKSQPATASNGQAAPASARDSTSFKSPPGETEASAGGPPTVAQVQPRRYWLLMGGSVALGVVLAFAAVTTSIYILQPTGQIAANSSAAVASSTAAPPRSLAPKASAAEPQPVESELAATPSTGETPRPVDASDATSPQKAAATEVDPLELVKSPPSEAVPTKTAGDALDKFDRILGGASDDPLAKSTARPRESPPPTPSDAAPPRPLAPRPPPREIDNGKRLADPLPAIETAGTPLADFLQLMSDISTIPITLELPFPPATPESPVVLRLTNATVGTALKEGLAPLRLEFVVSDDQLIVRRGEPNPFLPVSHDVKDLTGSDETQMGELAELLKAVIEPGSWGEEAGNGSITVDPKKGALVILHRRAVQGQVLVAIEKLRRSRTPPLAHKWKLDPALFKLDSRSALARSRLEKPISLNYSQPTRLTSILERLQEAAGVRIVVDWHDIASAGWNPAGEATFVVSNQPLAAALDALLGPLDLTWRICDGQTLQVVTPARLAGQGELEFYQVGELAADEASGEALVNKARAALGDGVLASGGNGEIRYELEGQCLLAWLPQPKQRELEALLARWRSERGK